MRAVVTGGAGFIGSHIAERLMANGHRVLIVDDLSGGFLDNLPKGSEFEKRSVTEDLRTLFAAYRPDWVYHLAAYAAEGLSHHIPVFNYRNNTVGTANVLSASYLGGAKHFVFTSSIAVYGHPTSSIPFSEDTLCRPCDPHGVAKLACEHHIRVFHDYYGTPSFTIVRPHNVFGPRQNVSDPYRNVVGIFLARALQGEALPIFGDGQQTRSFSDISAVAQCIAECPLVPGATNAVVNIGGDESMSVLELAKHIIRLTGNNGKTSWLTARHEVAHAHCTHEVARSLFPEAYHHARSVLEGLQIMIEYVRSHPFPKPTQCPSEIELWDKLPESWKGVTVRPT